MTKPKAASISMETTLSELDGLLLRLKHERWQDYDPVVTAACNKLARTALAELRKVATAIKNVEPAETRSGPGGATWGDPWYEGALDDMR